MSRRSSWEGLISARQNRKELVIRIPREHRLVEARRLVLAEAAQLKREKKLPASLRALDIADALDRLIFGGADD